MIPKVDQAHVVEGVAWLTSEYLGKPVTEGLLKSLLYRVQKTEDGIWSVTFGRTIGEQPARLPDPTKPGGYVDGIVNMDPSGVAIDILGQLVGADPRGARSDAEYLIDVKTQILVNRSGGGPEDILGILNLAVPTGTSVDYQESYPAGFTVTVLGSQGPVALATAIGRAKAPGVYVRFTYNAGPIENTLFWASTTGPVTVPGSTAWGSLWASQQEVVRT